MAITKSDVAKAIESLAAQGSNPTEPQNPCGLGVMKDHYQQDPAKRLKSNWRQPLLRQKL